VAKGERIILMDADLSHHPKFIPKMVEVMDSSKVEIVTGTRYALGGGVFGWNFKRKLTSKGANFLADFLLNPGVSDLTGSFRLYERRVLEEVLPKIQCTGYAFQMEIIVRSKKAGFSVDEVPITFVDRIYGESKLGTKEIIMFIKGLAQLFFTT
jgi:dolichol-phosphate mannosyltransferase